MTVPLRKRVRRAVRSVVLMLVLAPLWMLPLEVASLLGAWLGRLAFHLASRERTKALTSLRTAYPDWSDQQRLELAQRCFEHWGREALQLVVVDQLDERRQALVHWRPDARAAMDEALSKKKGVVFVTGHFGNWELLARFVALEGYAAAVIGKETSDARMTAVLERFRRSGNLDVIWRGDGGAAKSMLRALRQNFILGLLIDQDTKVQSVWVPFFGREAKTPRAAADLALRTGAVPMLGFCTRVGPLSYEISMERVDLPASEGEAAVRELTAALTAGIEAQIRRHPEQWVWMHERWKSRP